jgi:phosphohistidine phosphatase
MDLYIMRHAIAEEGSRTGKDCDRVLTPEGVERTQQSALALKKLEVDFDLILTSPFVRTTKTAQIIAEGLGCKKPEEFPPLASGQSSVQLLEGLLRLKGQPRSLLLVGHEPDLSRLISILLSGTDEIGITMKKGALCKLECMKIAPGYARLLWLMTSRQMSRMA